MLRTTKGLVQGEICPQNVWNWFCYFLTLMLVFFFPGVQSDLIDAIGNFHLFLLDFVLLWLGFSSIIYLLLWITDTICIDRLPHLSPYSHAVFIRVFLFFFYYIFFYFFISIWDVYNFIVWCSFESIGTLCYCFSPGLCCLECIIELILICEYSQEDQTEVVLRFTAALWTIYLQRHENGFNRWEWFQAIIHVTMQH